MLDGTVTVCTHSAALKKKILTTPNMSQGIIKIRSPLKKVVVKIEEVSLPESR